MDEQPVANEPAAVPADASVVGGNATPPANEPQTPSDPDGNGLGLVQPGTGEPGGSTTPTDADDDYADLLEPVDAGTPPPADPNAAPTDPNAAVPPATFDYRTLPQPMQSFFDGSNPYITTPETAAQAMEAATEIWDVQTGKTDAWSLFSAAKTYNPDRFKSMVQEVATGLLAETGMRLVKTDADGKIVSEFAAKQVDPAVAAMQREMAEFKKEKADRELNERNAGEQKVLQGIYDRLQTKFADTVKGTWLEGETDVHDRILAQMDKNKVDPKLARTDMDKYLGEYDRAYKEVKNAEVARVKRLNDNIRQHRQRIRASSPATPGSGAGSAKAQANATRPGQPQRSQFPEGEEGTSQWRSALYDFEFAQPAS